MTEIERSYEIVSRYMIKGVGWQRSVTSHTGTYESAGRVASGLARELDEAYGNDHFWTVDCINPESGAGYFQLFHGRLS